MMIIKFDLKDIHVTVINQTYVDTQRIQDQKK